MKTKEEIEETKKSYFTKEEFINMISSLNFCYIEDYDISLITGFVIKITDKGDECLSPLSKHIRYY